MGKIRKSANIYSRDGELIRKVSDKGTLEPYTIEELEDLIDKLGEDAAAFNNACAMLLQMYAKYGNPHKQELLDRIRTSKDDVTEALEEVDKEVSENESEYVEFEEVPNEDKPPIEESKV